MNMLRRIGTILVSVAIITIQSCANQNVVDNSANSTTTSEIELGKTVYLSSKLDEISGLEMYDGNYLGFNDSGGKNELYVIDAKNPNKIKKTVVLNNAQNKDWEDIAVSDEYVFIGDFGNNKGNRKDLRIYYFPTSVLQKEGETIEVDAEEIDFFYPEQKDYTKQSHAHDFDMEAMFYWKGKLHLFTKEWRSEKTHHYTLDLVKGEQPAWLVESYNLGYLATAADIFPTEDGVEIALIGYNTDTDVFLTTIHHKGNTPQFFSNSTIHKYQLGTAPELGQVEGVFINKENSLCFSAEAYKRKERFKKQNITCFKIKE